MQYLRMWPSFVLIFFLSHSAFAKEIQINKLPTGEQWLSPEIRRDNSELGSNLSQLFIQVSHGPFNIHPVTISSYFYKMHPMHINSDLIHYQANRSTLLSVNRSTEQHFQVRQADSRNQHWMSLAKQRVQSLVEAKLSVVSVGITFDDGDPGIAFKNAADPEALPWPLKMLTKIRVETDEIMLEFGAHW